MHKRSWYAGPLHAIMHGRERERVYWGSSKTDPDSGSSGGTDSLVELKLFGKIFGKITSPYLQCSAGARPAALGWFCTHRVAASSSQAVKWSDFYK